MIGIYKILNLVNKKCYIRQSLSINSRKNKHLTLLKNNKHDNAHLQCSWNKYGEDNFVCEIIEEIDENILKKDIYEILNEKEKYWIKYYKSNNNKFGYNKTKGGDGIKGYKHTPETLIKIGEASKKHKLSSKHKESLLKAITGRKKSPEELNKLSKAAKGRKISEWHKQRLKEGRENYVFTDEVRKKISESRKGFKMSDEQKKKLSEINKGKPSSTKKLTDKQRDEIKNIFIDNPYTSIQALCEKYNVGSSTIYGIRKKSGVKVKKVLSEESKKTISEKLKGRKLSEEHKHKISLNNKCKNQYTK